MMDQRETNELVDGLRTTDPIGPLHRSMGVILDANTTEGTATVQFSTGTSVSGIKYLDHVTATIGYTAWMIELGGDYLILGTTH